MVRKAVDEGWAVCQHPPALDSSGAAVEGLALQMFYSVRSERMLMEQLSHNLLFRWFVGMEMDEPVWNHAVFRKNPERLPDLVVGTSAFRACAGAGCVDGTPIEAAKPMAPTFAGTSVPTTRTSRKPIRTPSSTGKARDRKPSWGHLGHVLMENSHGLNRGSAGDSGRRNRGTGCGFADGLPEMAEATLGGPRAAMSVGADQAYDTRDFVKTLREMGVRPHVAQNLKRSRPTHEQAQRYRVSQNKQPLIEKAFGWMKQTARNPQNQASRHLGSLMAVSDDGGGSRSFQQRTCKPNSPQTRVFQHRDQTAATTHRARRT